MSWWNFRNVSLTIKYFLFNKERYLPSLSSFCLKCKFWKSSRILRIILFKHFKNRVCFISWIRSCKKFKSKHYSGYQQSIRKKFIKSLLTIFSVLFSFVLVHNELSLQKFHFVFVMQSVLGAVIIVKLYGNDCLFTRKRRTISSGVKNRVVNKPDVYLN